MSLKLAKEYMGIQEKSHVYGYKLHGECVVVKNIFISSHMMSCYIIPSVDHHWGVFT